MADAALDMRAWREAGIQAFGYAACASLFQAPARAGGMRPVRAITPAFTPEPTPGPVQREMPFLAVVEPAPRLSRADTMTVRRRILADQRFTAKEREAVKACLWHQWYGKTECNPGNRAIARRAGVSVRTVQRAMEKLTDGYMRRERRGRLGNPKGGRRSNRYILQLEFCFGTKPINHAKRPDNKPSQDSATDCTTVIEPKGHDNRSTSTPQTPLSRQPEAKATSTPVRQGGGGGTDGPPCPRCGSPLSVDRVSEGTFFQCRARECWHSSFTPSQEFARVGNYKDNLVFKRREAIRSRRSRRSTGNPYADRRT